MIGGGEVIKYLGALDWNRAAAAVKARHQIPLINDSKTKEVV